MDATKTTKSVIDSTHNLDMAEVLDMLIVNITVVSVKSDFVVYRDKIVKVLQNKIMGVA